MAKQKQSTHQPFLKPFYKLLGGCVLGLAIVYGGIVWASLSLDECKIMETGFGRRGNVCVKLGTTQNDKSYPITIPANNAQIGVKGFSKTEIGKQLRFTNKHSNKEVFIPTRSKAELLSVLKAKQSGKNPVLNNIEICEVGLSASQPSTAFGNGVMGCDSDDCKITIVKGKTCRVKSGVLNDKKYIQNYWLDGSPMGSFDSRIAGNLAQGGNERGLGQYLYSSKNTIRTCGRTGYSTDRYRGYWPYQNGNRWAEYKCFVCRQWDCVPDRAYWQFVRMVPNPSRMERWRKETNTSSNSYIVKARQYYITYSGSYKTWCESNNDYEPDPRLNDQIIEDRGYKCNKSCSNFNRWDFSPNTEPPAEGCSNGTSTSSRYAEKTVYCRIDGCETDSNCTLENSGRDSKKYRNGFKDIKAYQSNRKRRFFRQRKCTVFNKKKFRVNNR